MSLLGPDGEPLDGGKTMAECDHGVVFDQVEAEKILDEWQPNSSAEWILGNPAAADVKKLWPRLNGTCPKGCGYVGIYYASHEHYILGDW